MGLLHQSIQHAIVNLFDLVSQLSVLVVNQPLEDRFFVLQVALVQKWISVSTRRVCQIIGTIQ